MEETSPFGIQDMLQQLVLITRSWLHEGSLTFAYTNCYSAIKQ